MLLTGKQCFNTENGRILCPLGSLFSPQEREGQGFACLKHNSCRNVSAANNESLAIGSP